MKKILTFVFAIFLIFLGGCAGQKTLTTEGLHQHFHGEINTNTVMYVAGAGQKQTPSFLGQKTIIFSSNPIKGLKENGNLLLEEIEKNPQLKIIIAHSYGASVLVEAMIRNHSIFKNMSVILLTPTLAGSDKATNASSFRAQLALSIVSWFGPDFRPMAKELDPLGDFATTVLDTFSSLKKNVISLITFTVKGDPHGPNEKSPKVFKKNYERIAKSSIILEPETNRPHEEVLERQEVFETIHALL